MSTKEIKSIIWKNKFDVSGCLIGAARIRESWLSSVEVAALKITGYSVTTIENYDPKKHMRLRE